MAIQILPLTAANIPQAVEVIQQAFADDPYFQWAFDSATFNKERNCASLSSRCHWGISNAIFHIARESSEAGEDDAKTSRVLGVSCWLPPHSAAEAEGWYSWLQSWTLSFNQLLNNVRYLGHGGLRTNRYWIWKDRQREAQSQIWDDPRGYYFCNIIAIRPEAQGKGIGRRLFEAVAEQTDREGMKCYLESSKLTPNTEIYERLGFHMAREMECRDGDDVCMLYCMVRDPKSN
ncbi:gcn5-related n-acetyltransferase [Grosmannia clavigera kw1407]|uniref:Gcn5-related n-acetyltransferase n=1 Tax=Grosmannia clavigera (strain kw1407 / UAMH 11150) TaxID=655863 RepID=F0XDR9_GROCL|nr:gcn5-related n-acetyltransferase [Grosmannia clavigera kw1407]EFX04450.1 gcn5-related n-acetyltransferase [Grosmannia clavigera kw1407]